MNELRVSSDETDKVELIVADKDTDTSLILPLVRQAHKESYFADLPFDKPQFEQICSFARDKPGFYGGLHVELDGVPVGFAFYMFRPLLGSDKTWITIMHSLYLRAEVRSTPIGGYIWNRMLAAVRTWSIPRGSKGMMFNVISGVAVEETDTVLRAAGATYVGGNYFMRI